MSTCLWRPRSDAYRAALTSLVAGLAACSSGPPPAGPAPQPGEPSTTIHQEGIASWYGPGFDGRTTASGEAFDSDAFTAAHRSLPFGTLVRVINVDNGSEVVVRINDRGPFIDGRIIDVSQAAARALGMIRSGTARVRLILER